MPSPIAEFFVWWQPLVAALAVAIAVFGGGGLLWMGARFLARERSIPFGHCTGTIVLALFCSGLVVTFICLPTRYLGLYGVVFIAALAVVAWQVTTWVVIKVRLDIPPGKAVLAWAPTLLQLVLILPIMVPLTAPTLSAIREADRRTLCRARLEEIGRFVVARMADGNDAPPTLQDLLDSNQIPPDCFKCPSCDGKRTCDFFYSFAADSGDHDQCIACDLRGNHRKGIRNILYADGHTDSEPADRFQAILKSPCNAAFAKALAQTEALAEPDNEK